MDFRNFASAPNVQTEPTPASITLLDVLLDDAFTNLVVDEQYASAEEVFDAYLVGREDDGSGASYAVFHSSVSRLTRRELEGDASPRPNGLLSLLELALEEYVVQVVRREVSSMRSAGTWADEPTWVTPPVAARRLGIGEKAVRRLITMKAVTPRLRNITSSPKQRKYLVNVDEVAEALSRRPASVDEPAESISEQAARIRAKAAVRK